MNKKIIMLVVVILLILCVAFLLNNTFGNKISEEEAININQKLNNVVL